MSIKEQVDHLLALQEGWDGDGGKPITKAAVKAVINLLLHSKPHLTPCSNGGVQIDWPNGEIAFGPDGKQEFD